MARTNLPQRLRRDTVELMREAAAWLGPDADETAIHEARKCIKRARALTALLRSAGGAAASRVNEELCTINRQLSPRRDRDVLQATFLKLLDKSAEHAELQQFLAERESANATLPEPAMTLESLAEALLQAAEDWKRTELPRGDWSLIADDFRRIYRRGRRSSNGDLDTDEAWHTLRKGAKKLLYAVDFLRWLSPQRLAGEYDQIDKLTELLGKHHDLAVLKLELAAPAWQSVPELRETLLQRLLQRQNQLAKKARRGARMVYAESTEAYCHRFQTYWRASRAG